MTDDFENISAVSIQYDYLLNNRYKLGDKIGEGSYGKVFKAKDTKNKNKLVAIKQVSKMRINSNPYLVEALQKELHIMKLLSDENSVKLLEDFENQEYYNFVMELCDNDLDGELKKHIKITQIGFNELEVNCIMTQFNKIFKKMQNEHVIHRDLKLKNIMIKYDKKIPFIGFIVKLSDFGFSKVVNDEELTGTNLGSPATKAPEIMQDKNYNAKVDLWSVGVIMFQLFYNKLPFPAKNARELKMAIFNSNGVQLPKDNNNKMSDICFELIDKLLQKDVDKRINFEEYFNHKFFSEEHKKRLVEIYKKQNEKDNNEKKSENIRISETFNLSTNDDSYNDKEIKNLEERFKKLLKIKEYNNDYILYKAKDTKYHKYVYIKEISCSIIDNNERNKKIFKQEINLLNNLSGNKFPKLIKFFKTKTHYNIVIEYFYGKNLYNFINDRHNLSESLVVSIINQLKSSFKILDENNITLEFISPKNFAFSYYQNETNFEIKFFDYGLNSIFFEEKYIKYYLLEEAELGKVNDSSINILSLGLTIYKMLFGEEAKIKNNGEYEVKIKGKIKSEYREKIKNFLSRCIKKEKRYNYYEFFLDNFLTFNNVDQQNYDKSGEPMIKDENFEIILEIIKKKLDYIIKYFDKLFDEKDNFLDSDLYNNYYDEIITLLLFCLLESKTILKFLKINADTNSSEIDKADQEIHLFKIYLNNKNKEESKYDYTNINFSNENKNAFLYNKENPTFELYFKIFSNIQKNIESIYNKFIGKNKDNNILVFIDESNSSGEEFFSACSSINNTQEKAFNDNIDLRSSEKEGKISQEGNLDKLFFKMFENGTIFYNLEEKEKAIEHLNLAKYLAEYIIIHKVILGNKEKNVNFDKILLNNDKDNENENIIFATFLGGKIKLLKEKGILGYNNNESNENLVDENGPKIKNIIIYDTMINFYPQIIQFINEINQELK